MVFRKIAGPMRIDCADGNYMTYQLEGRPGGRSAKVAQYSVMVLQRSSDAVRLAVDLDHGPTGQAYAPHSAPITDGNPGSVLPAVLIGDANQSVILNDYLRPTIKIKNGTGTTPQWAVVEVYEMRKPF